MVIRVGSSPILHTKIKRLRSIVAFLFTLRWDLNTEPFGSAKRFWRKTKANSPVDCSAGRSHRRKSHPSHQIKRLRIVVAFLFTLRRDLNTEPFGSAERFWRKTKANSPVDCSAGRSHRRKSGHLHIKPPETGGFM